MGAAAYVGRVGGLAVALGVGAAVATGHGVASADTPDPGSQSGSSTANSPANEPSSGTSGSTQSSTSTSTQTANTGSPSGTRSTNSATATTGVAVSPGRAQLRGKAFKDGYQTASEAPDEEEETEVVESEGSQDVSSPTQSPTPTR
jgi:hypothetical protein